MIALNKWFDINGRVVDIKNPTSSDNTADIPWDQEEFGSLVQSLFQILPSTTLEAIKAINEAGMVPSLSEPLLSTLVVYNTKAKRIDIEIDIIYPVTYWRADSHIRHRRACIKWKDFNLEPKVRFLLAQEAASKYGVEYLRNLHYKMEQVKRQAEGTKDKCFGMEILFGVET